jgi:hypothetical protein
MPNPSTKALVFELRIVGGHEPAWMIGDCELAHDRNPRASMFPQPSICRAHPGGHEFLTTPKISYFMVARNGPTVHNIFGGYFGIYPMFNNTILFLIPSVC